TYPVASSSRAAATGPRARNPSGCQLSPATAASRPPAARTCPAGGSQSVVTGGRASKPLVGQSSGGREEGSCPARHGTSGTGTHTGAGETYRISRESSVGFWGEVTGV